MHFQLLCKLANRSAQTIIVSIRQGVSQWDTRTTWLSFQYTTKKKGFLLSAGLVKGAWLATIQRGLVSAMSFWQNAFGEATKKKAANELTVAPCYSPQHAAHHVVHVAGGPRGRGPRHVATPRAPRLGHPGPGPGRPGGPRHTRLRHQPRLPIVQVGAVYAAMQSASPTRQTRLCNYVVSLVYQSSRQTLYM